MTVSYDDDDPQFRLHADGTSRWFETSTFCGSCGYNLKTLPRVGRCPECGGGYDGRVREMKNILVPESLVLPWGDIMASAIGLTLSALTVYYFLVHGWQWFMLVCGVLFGAAGLFLARVSAREVGHYVHCRRLVKRMQVLENE